MGEINENNNEKREFLMSCACGNKKSPDCYGFDKEILEIGLDKLNPVFEKYGKVEGGLVTILQNAQEIYGYLPYSLLSYIADKVNIKPAKVLGVATFYTQFRLKPVGKYLILLCQGTACHVNGSIAIEEAIKEELQVKEGDITEDGLFTYNNVACLGCCSLSPVMMINGEVYGSLTAEKTKKILAGIREGETK